MSRDRGVPADAQTLLDFWFEELGPEAWYGGGTEVDDLIRDRYQDHCDRAAGPVGRALLGWDHCAEGMLALVITLDQFPRNLYRGDANSFATDALALSLALEAIDKGFDLALPKNQRMFFYLPMQHAEDLDIQERSIELTVERVGDETNIEYAKLHRDIIARFGRFPHRNAILGRESTPEEEAYLAEDAPTFGTQ